VVVVVLLLWLVRVRVASMMGRRPLPGLRGHRADRCRLRSPDVVRRLLVAHDEGAALPVAVREGRRQRLLVQAAPPPMGVVVVLVMVAAAAALRRRGSVGPRPSGGKDAAAVTRRPPLVQFAAPRGRH
jgi:hypothetical protein